MNHKWIHINLFFWQSADWDLYESLMKHVKQIYTHTFANCIDI